MTSLETFAREDFIQRRFHYRPGDHVTILGPTGTGKTYLGYQLLGHVADVDLPGLALIMKPRDKTVETWTRKVGFKKVTSWPPKPSFWSIWFDKKPPGYVLWPKHSFDIDRDNAMLWREFRKALMDSYKRGDRILFADEAYGLSNELDLNTELIALWTRGRSMGTGLWVASQKPTHIPLHAYNQAQHLFLFRDPDKRARDRYSEISGVDPSVVRNAVLALKKHQCLYIRQDGPKMCIVDK